MSTDTSDTSDTSESPTLSDALAFRPIRSQNLFEETVGRLGAAVRVGVVRPGERFPPERTLADLLGVSRVTVREALRALQQAGLIEIRRGRHGGAYVTDVHDVPSIRRARQVVRELGIALPDVLEYRWALEPAAADLAAAKATRRGVERLRRLEEQCRSAGPDEYRPADTRLHLAIAETADSPTLAHAVADVRTQVGEILEATPMLPESIRHSDEQHRAVVDAIAAGDGEAARLAMEEHVEATAELIRALG